MGEDIKELIQHVKMLAIMGDISAGDEEQGEEEGQDHQECVQILETLKNKMNDDDFQSLLSDLGA